MTTDIAAPRHLALSLLLIRISIVVMLLPWVLDKFVNPDHAVGIFEHFYGVGGVPVSLVYGVGAVQILVLLAFGLGIARSWSYGLVVLMHGLTTFASWRQYLAPYEGANLLFFAAWPMLAACITLFLLRTLGTLGSRRR